MSERPTICELNDQNKALVHALRPPWYKLTVAWIGVAAVLASGTFFVLRGEFQTIGDADADAKESREARTAILADTKLLVGGLVDSIRENAANVNLTRELGDKEDTHQNAALRRLERRIARMENRR